MQVNLDPILSQSEGEKLTSVKPSQTSQITYVPSSRSEKPASDQNTSNEGLHEPDVTFRRDSNGQIYYVVTDSQSGKELREVPAEEIRKVGEGIAEYLKREEAKTSVHLELNA